MTNHQRQPCGCGMVWNRQETGGADVSVRIEQVDDDTVRVGFAYDASKVEQIKARLASRRWDPESRCWLVHLCELALLCDLLEVPAHALPPPVRKAYAERWADGLVELRIGPVQTAMAGSALPLVSLEQETAFPVQGAQFHPAYQAGEWDGYRRLLRHEGMYSFPTGLLPRVRRVLEALGRPLRIIDERQVPVPQTRSLPMGGPPLRPYQQQVLAAALVVERGVLQLATGAGKTLVAAHLVAACGVPSVFIVHTRDLFYQAVGVFEEVLQEPIGRIGDGTVLPERHTVVTIQTAARAFGIGCSAPNPEEPLEPDPTDIEREDRAERVRETLITAQLATFDECHHLPSDTAYELSRQLQNAYFRYGLSATPYRDDGTDLLIEAALGPTIARVDTSCLIREGYLVPPRIVFLRPPPPANDLTGLPYARLYDRAVVRNVARNTLLADTARSEYNAGRSVLVLTAQVRHARLLHALLPEAELVTGQDPADRRKSVLERFRERRLRLLIATTLADEGLDLPVLDVLVLAGGGRSETRALQRVGRVLRPAEGKTQATIYDCWDDVPILSEHSRRRKCIYETEPLFEIVMTGEPTAGERQGMLF